MRPVNLLPDQYRRRPRGAGGGLKGGAHLALGALASLLVMVAVYALTVNHKNSRESDAAEARAQADELQGQVRQLGAFGNFAQIKQTRVSSVQSLAAVRFDWERLLREVARVLPRGAWLQDMNASVTGADSSSGSSTGSSSSSSSSSSASSSSSSTPGQPSARLTGCAPRQSEVAQMMVRLRKIYRAQDVQLEQSAQDDSKTAPSAESCGRFYTFDLLVSFTQAPAREAPPGARRVPASLGGGS